MAAIITKRSRTWATVTPLVQIANELTGAEWKRLVEGQRNAAEAPIAAATV